MKMPQNNSIENCYNFDDSPYISESVNTANENGANNAVDEFAPPAGDNDFEEYLWMENEEEFDKEVMQRLEEEALMEQCIAAMLEDEEIPETAFNQLNITRTLNGSNNVETNDVLSMVNNLRIDSTEAAKTSTLNPLAAEFVPASRLKVASADSQH